MEVRPFAKLKVQLNCGEDLAGITLHNSIMMISHFERLVVVEGPAWSPATVIGGASFQLLPIVMTSLATALGLLTLEVGMPDPACLVEGPLAATILGGLITSLVLNLIVLPPLALAFGHFECGRGPAIP